MAGFLNLNRNTGSDSSDDYTRVADDEEQKSLSREYEPEAAHDEHQNSAEIYALNRSIKRTNLFLKVIIGLLVVCILSLLSLQGPDAYQKLKKQTSTVTNALLPTPVPPLSTQIVTFQKNDLYADRPNEVSDKAWNELLPPGRGFVFLPDWKKYDLPEGEVTPWGTIYSVAVFHQMHCLGQLRRFTWMFLDAIVANGTEGTSQRADIVKLFHVGNHADHIHHCFDYLRQTIQCGGDMTMEWPRTEKDGRRLAVDGWGIPHECKNWNTIMDYMDKNHFNMSMNAEIAPIHPPPEG